MTIVHGIDVSNWQGPRVVALAQEHQASHVMVRASLEPHLISMGRHQFTTLREAGYACDPYLWVYWTHDPAELIHDALNTYSALVRPDPIWWLDCEDTDGLTGTDPGTVHQWLARAVDHLERSTWRAGIYTGRWWWDRYAGGTEAFSRLPLLLAHYDGSPNLTSSLMPFGGWQALAGKQYTDSPIDLDVWAHDVLYPQESCCTDLHTLRGRLLSVVQSQKTITTRKLARLLQS